MNELNKQIRKDAGALLDELIQKVEDAVVLIAAGYDIEPSVLERLAIGGRTDSIYGKAVIALAKEREAELLALYQKKPELKAVGGR